MNDVKKVSGDSEIWTSDFKEAQTFRTEAAATVAKKHLRDFYNIDTTVSVLGYA